MECFQDSFITSEYSFGTEVPQSIFKRLPGIALLSPYRSWAVLQDVEADDAISAGGGLGTEINPSLSGKSQELLSCCRREIRDERQRKEAGGKERGLESEEKPIRCRLGPTAPTPQWPRSAWSWIRLFDISSKGEWGQRCVAFQVGERILADGFSESFRGRWQCADLCFLERKWLHCESAILNCVERKETLIFVESKENGFSCGKE